MSRSVLYVPYGSSSCRVLPKKKKKDFPPRLARAQRVIPANETSGQQQVYKTDIRHWQSDIKLVRLLDSREFSNVEHQQ